MLTPFTAGEDLTAARLNAAFDIIRVVVQVGDSANVNNSTTLVSSTYLTLAVEASAVYLAEYELIYDTNSTADFKSSLTLPAGATVTLARWTSGTTGTAIDSAIEHNADTLVTMSSGGVAVGTRMSCRRAGIVVMSTTAGNATIQFAQNVANVSNTFLSRGSWLRLTKVA